MRGVWGLAILALSAAARAEEPIIISSGPSQVSITFYRDSHRSPSRPLDLDPTSEDPLGGFALIDEVREVDLPPGEVTLRFEGVASGIVPQSAILFETALAEKNFDSRLLSQRGLIDSFTGQRISIRRTDPRTGIARTEPGTILSAPDALILRTKEGVEAVQCEGSLSTLLFPRKPADLTAKPTLSLRTRPGNKGGKVMLHLAYLAANFDWQANYVGTFSPDGKSLDLTGWMTLASRDKTRFDQAEVSAVAGMVARAARSDDEVDREEAARESDPYSPDNIEISAACWPLGRTSPTLSGGQMFLPGSLPTIQAPIVVEMAEPLYGNGCTGDDCGDIVVTAQKRTERADLGDLKLYTISHRADVGAQSIKQVRFLGEHRIVGEVLYRGNYRDESISPAKLVFRFDNRRSAGLGEPLPLGQMLLFQNTRLGRQLLGETQLGDKAQYEQVAIELPEDADLDVDFDEESTDASGDDWTGRKATITNNRSFAVTAEVTFSDSRRYRLSRFSGKTIVRDGQRIWRVSIPPGKERSIQFRSTELPEPEID